MPRTAGSAAGSGACRASARGRAGSRLPGGARRRPQRQQFPEPETREVLAVHERVGEPAAGQEPGDTVPVAGLGGPVQCAAEVAVLLEPGRGTLLQPAESIVIMPL